MQFSAFAKRLATVLLTVGISGGQPAAQPPGAPAYPSPQIGGPVPGGVANSGPIQAVFLAPAGGGQTTYVDAYGNPVILPASYMRGGCDSGHRGVFGRKPSVNPMGVGTDPPFDDGMIDPIGVPGMMAEQCGPHYFDVRAEAVHMVRDETFGSNVDFTTLNVDGEVVLSSSQLDYDYETGFRLVGRCDLGPLSVVEFSYFGIYDWGTSASFTDPNPVDGDTGNLYSLFSDFGTNPPTVAIEGGPMPETERSITQSISLESDLQTAEASYRRYWVGFCPWISGTILAGFRYTEMDEEFLFSTVGEGSMDYGVETRNALTGFQIGGDAWIHLLRGVRLGAEGKVGIYNNRLKIRSDIDSVGPTNFNGFPEVFQNNQVALISEVSTDLVIDVLPSWSLRFGCEALYLNSVALAGENFNTASPYGLVGQAPRIPFAADQGSAFYYGGHAGFEYIW